MEKTIHQFLRRVLGENAFKAAPDFPDVGKMGETTVSLVGVTSKCRFACAVSRVIQILLLSLGLSYLC